MAESHMYDLVLCQQNPTYPANQIFFYSTFLKYEFMNFEKTLLEEL